MAVFVIDISISQSNGLLSIYEQLLDGNSDVKPNVLKFKNREYAFDIVDLEAISTLDSNRHL